MFTIWWRRDAKGPAPSDAALTTPLALTDRPVHLAGTEDLRIAWSPWTGEHRTGMAANAGSGVYTVCWARLDNITELRTALARHLPPEHMPTADAHPAEWILAAYLAWGDDVVDHLCGDYSITVVDLQRRCVLAWRDAIGVRPLVYADAAGAAAISTAVNGLRAIPGVSSDVDPAWLVHMGLGITSTHESAPFIGMARVPGGHVLRMTAEGTQLRRYFHFDPFSSWSDHVDDSWVHVFQERLRQAVGDRLPRSGPVASEATAGLDSSGVIATLAGHVANPDRLHLFGCTWPGDTEPLIRATGQRYGVADITINPTWEANEYGGLRESVAQALGYPFSHGIAIELGSIYRMCQQAGIDTLYSGLGGDHCVSHPASQAVLEWIDRRKLWGAARHAVAPGWKAPGRVALAQYQWRSNWPEPMGEFHLMMSTGFRPEALEAADAIALIGRNDPLFAARTVNSSIVSADGAPHARYAGYWLRRAEECSITAALYGVEYVWPLLDVRLMQQYLWTPTAEKLSRGHTRYLFRRAISSDVPAEVAWRPSKVPGGTPPLRPADVDTRSVMPVRINDLHPALAELLNPDVLTCGLDNSVGTLGRVSQLGVHRADAWLRSLA